MSLTKQLKLFLLLGFSPPAMVKLSVVVITLNEEKNLGRCLSSVRGVADEIVIVDSNSTDGTEAIAKAFHARFIQHPFEGYVKQKNFANEQAGHDHILSLDADEVLSDELRTSVLNAKARFNKGGYTMNRRTNYAGKWVKHSGWYPDRKLRLFDRRKGHWEGMIIHEEFKLSENAKPGHLKGDLLHYSFDSVEDHRKQSRKFTTLGAQADFQRGKKAPFYKIYLGPVVKFIQSYFLRFGFLDGRIGLTICWLSAAATHQKYLKLKKLYQSK
jgi:glycosyltransferase involved in cell wall biosynthesis